jgi:hypothetical protein
MSAAAKRALARRHRKPRPAVEALEDRTLLSVTVSGSGNTATILGTVGDQVWLRTSGTQFQYSTDGTNYTNLESVSVTQDATVTLGGLGQVHVVGLAGQGHAITLQPLGAGNGSAGQLASPNLLTVEGNVTTAGGDLSILNMQGIEVDSNVVVSTRNVGASTDYLNAASVGSSGALTLTSENPDTLNPILNIGFDHPHVTLDSGARLLAQVGSGSAFSAGNVTLSARNTNYSLGSASFSSLSVLDRAATVNLDGATVMGAGVNVTSDAGDQNLLHELTSAVGGNGGTVLAGTIQAFLPFLTDMLSLPISFGFKKADSTVEVGQGTAQNFTTANVNPSTGEITFGAATSLSTGDPVTYASTGTAIGGLAGGATYFAIVDSPTTLRLASSKANALAGTAITGLVPADAGGTQSLTPDSQVSGSDVSIDSSAESDAEGEAIYYGQFGGSQKSGNLIEPNQLGFALAVAVGIPTANALVDSGSQVTASGAVTVSSSASSTTSNLARVSQNLGSLSNFKTFNSTLGQYVDGSTQQRIQIAGAFGVDDLTAHSTVAQYADVAAGGNASITATGSNTDKNSVTTASYYDGKAGFSTALNIDVADVKAYVDGTVTSANSSTLSAPTSLTFNPFTGVRTHSDPLSPDTIDFGTTNPGYALGDAVVYDSDTGGAIDGLTSGQTYYAIPVTFGSPTHYGIRLATTRADALAKTNYVTLADNPTLTDTTTGATLPFTQVDETTPLTFTPGSGVNNNQINFGVDDGYYTGEPVTYTTNGSAVGGLSNGGTYYVIVVNGQTIELDNSYADAVSANPSPIALDPTQASGDQDVSPFGSQDQLAFDTQPTVDDKAHTINFGVSHSLVDGQPVVYTSSGTPLTGLTSGATYYVITVDATTIQLATRSVVNGDVVLTPIAITGVGAGGTQTVTALTPIQFGYDEGINAGDQLVYHAVAGKLVGGLVDGQTYTAALVPSGANGQPDTTETGALVLTSGGTPVALNLNPILTSPDGSTTYTIGSIDTDSNTLIFDPTLGYSFTAGQPLVYHAALGTKVSGLTDGTTYYAVVDANNPYVLELAATKNDALSASAAVTAQSTANTTASSLVPVGGGTDGLIVGVDAAAGTLTLGDPAPNFAANQAVVYHQATRDYVGGLVDGQTYYVIPVSGDPNTVQLAASPNGGALTLDNDSVLVGGGQTLDIFSDDPSTGTLQLFTSPATPVATGDAFVFHHAVGDGVNGLVDGQTYYAIARPDTTTLKLATSYANAVAGTAVTLTAALTDASGNTLLIQQTDANAHTVTLYAPLTTPLHTGDTLTYHANGTPLPGLLDGATYYVVNDQPGGINPATITLSQVAGGGSAISLPGHGFYTGEAVTYTTGGTAISPLSPTGVYYVIVIDANTIALASSLTNARNGVALTLSMAVASGTQTLTPAMGSAASFNPSSVVAPGSNAFVVPSNNLITGEAVTYNTTGTAIPSLTPGAVYYAISVDQDTFQLASSRANAVNGVALTNIDPTGAEGTQTFTPVQGSTAAATFAPSSVSAAANTITVPGHGYVTGEVVQYASSGQDISGLSSGSNYYVIVVDANTIQLALSAEDAYAGNAIALDPPTAGATDTETLTPATPDTPTVSFNPSPVRPAGNTFALPSHGFVTGQAVVYTAGGAAMGGLTSGATYYVIVVDADMIRLASSAANAFDGIALAVDPTAASGAQTLSPAQPVLQLADSYADATAATPVVLSLQGAIDLGDVDNTVMSGADHTFTADAPGVIITASLTSSDTSKTKSGLGSEPSLNDLLTQGQLTGQLGNGLANYNPINATGVQPNKDKPGQFKTNGNPVSDAIKNQLPKDGAGKVQEGGSPYSVAGSFGIVVTDFNVTAEVGPDAVIASGKNVTVEGTINEKQQTSTEGTISKPDKGSNTKVSAAVAFEAGVFLAHSYALIDPGATVDASGTLKVHANDTYPFIFPFRTPTDSSSLTKLFANPATDLGFLLGGNLGLQNFFVNNWTRTVSKPGSGMPKNELGVALSLDVNIYDNVADAQIGAGAHINQTPAYQTAKQTVTVASETYVDEINITGMFDVTLSPDGVAKSVRKRTLIDPAKNDGSRSNSMYAYEQLFSLFGNRAGATGIGVSAPIEIIVNTPTAEIDSGARVHVGAAGSLNVNAVDRNFVLEIGQSGGQAKTTGFSGTLSLIDLTANTTARVESGVIVTGGGAVNVTADDDTNLINLNGAFQTSQGTSIGVSVAINAVQRNTLAIVGDKESSPGALDGPSGSSTYGSATTPMGAFTVQATETGNLVTSAIAASVTTDSPPSAAAGGSISDDLKRGDATGIQNATKAGELSDASEGVGASGAVGLNLITADNAEAYVNDKGTFYTGADSITVSNASLIISLTGGVGVSLKAGKPNLGLAGAVSVNTILDTNRAFIDGATLVGDGLTLDAERGGFTFALTAGVGVAAGTSGTGVAVALASNTITGDTEAFVRDANLTLAGDTSVKAHNDDQIWAIDGAVAYGGKTGFGAAVSLNIILDKAYAYLADSTVTQSAGGLTVSGVSDNFGSADARIIAITASVGAAGQGLGISGTISLNLVEDDNEAYLSGTTYTDTASGQSATVTAHDDSAIISIAGAAGLSFSGDLGFGAAGAYNEIIGTSKAYLEGSEVSLLGDLTVKAYSTSTIGGVTVGVAGSDQGYALAGSVSINIINDTIDAHISQAPAGTPTTTGNVSGVTTPGNVTVSSSDTSTLVALAGGGAFSASGSAVGAAISYDLIQNTLNAYIDGTSVTDGTMNVASVTVSADSTPVLVSLAVGGAGGDSFALGGSLTINSIANTVGAYIHNSTVGSAGGVQVTAYEEPVMVVLAGGIAISTSGGAVGAAIAYNFIGGSFDPANPNVVIKPSSANDQMSADIENSTVTSANGDVDVLAGYKKPSSLPGGGGISLLSAGSVTLPVSVAQALVSIAIGGAGADSFALGGSVNVNLMRGSADAHITSTAGNTVTAGGAVVVGSSDVEAIGSAAGALAIAGDGAAVGAAISTDDIANDVTARIEGATANGSAVQVTANEGSYIVNLTVAGAGGNDSALGGSLAVNQIHDTVDAHISSGADVTSGGDVTVRASDTSVNASLGGGIAVAGEGGGVGAALTYNVITNVLKAYVDGSTINSTAGGLDVSATSSPVLVAVALGGAGAGSFALGGSLTINTIANTIDAHVSSSTVTVADSVGVAASESAVMVVLAGGIAISPGGAAVGAAIAYNYVGGSIDPANPDLTHRPSGASDQVTAYIDGSAVSAGGNIAVTAGYGAPTNPAGTLTMTTTFDPGTAVNTSADTINVGDNSGFATGQPVVYHAGTGNTAIGGLTDGTTYYVIKPANDATHIQLAATGADAAAGKAIDLTSVGTGAGHTLTRDQLSLAVGTYDLPSDVKTELVSVALGGAGAGDFALGGSINLNFVRDSLDAYIGDTPAGKSVTAGGNVIVTAGDSSTIGSAAGALAIAIDGAAIGAAVSTNDISNNVTADIQGATVSGYEVEVGTTEDANIDNVTAAGSGAEAFALGGSVSVNLIRNTAQADIASGAKVTGTALVQVSSADTSTIYSLSGAGAFSAGVGVGAAAAVNDISNTTNAYIDGSGTSVSTPAGSGGDVTVSAESTPSIWTLAGGIAASGSVAVAGSTAVNVMANHVDSYINAATVTADGSALVLGTTDPTLYTWAGTIDGSLEVGIGGTAAVNYLGNTTKARIDGGAHVTANGNGSPIGVDQWANDGDGTHSTEQIHGLAVIASTQETIGDIATTFSISIPNGDGSAVGIGINFEVNVFDDTTDAHIDGSFVNSANDNGSAVIVRAHDEIDVTSAGGALATGDEGFGAVVDTDVYTSTTSATVGGSTVYAGGDVEVSALTRENVTSATAGAGVGTYVGFAGGASGVNIGGSTMATINDSSAVYSHGNLTVRADDGVNLHLGDGVLGGSLAVGAGGAIAVALDGHTTSATIDSSTTDATGLTLVQADSAETLLDVAVAAGIGGIAGVAGAVGVVSLTAGVTAAIIAADVNQDESYKNSGQGVTVKATDNASVTDGLGGLAGSLIAGVGAAVDVITIKDTVDAYVGDSSKVSAGGDITVEADGDKTFSSNVFSFALGGSASLNGTVTVVGIGGGLDSQGTSQIQGSNSKSFLNTINNNLSLGNGAPGLNSNIGTEQDAQTLTQSSAMDVTDALGTDQTPRDTTAWVGKNVTLKAGGAVSVTATETIHASTALAGQGTGSFGVSVGASVAVVDVNSAVQAYVQDGSSIDAGGDVTVAAHFTDNVTAKSFAGTAGFVGLGAQVSVITDNASESATLGNVSVTSANALNVNATADRTLDAEAAGGSAGAIVAGAAIAHAVANGSTTATLGGQIGQAAGESVGAVTVSATSTDSAKAYSVAVVAGIGGGSANESRATIDPTLSAAVSGGAKITSTGAVLVQAQGMPHANAQALGLTISATVSVGVVTSFATAADAVSADLGNSVSVSAPSLEIDAEQTQDAAKDRTAESSATAGVGGLLAGANATDAEAAAGGSVMAYTGNSVTLPDGDVSVIANNETVQSSDATGVAAGLYFAVGADVAKSTSGVTTSAQLGSVTSDAARTGALTVRATGYDENDASTTAGSGGIVAGDASVGITGDTSTVAAGLGGGTIYAGTVEVSADNTSQYTPNVNSVNAAAAGASGADSENDDTTSATTSVAGDTGIVAAHAVALTAQNTFLEVAKGDTVTAAAGGLLNGTAALSNSTLDGTAGVTVGNGVFIDVMTQSTETDTRGILLSASGVLTTDDQVTLTTGGAIEGAGTNSSLNGTLDNNVSLGNNDDLMTNRNIEAGTYTTVHAENNSEVSTYGLAGVGVADATTDVTTNQTVALGTNTDLTAFGNVNLTAGDDTNPVANNTTMMSGVASAQGYVRGLIAVPDASATTTLTSNATLTVGSGDQIKSGQNTTLAADTGTPSAVADGTGHGYELGFIPVTDGSSTHTTPSSSKATINGTIQAGIYHELTITIPDARNDGGGTFTDPTKNGGIQINTDGAPYAAFTIGYDGSFTPSSDYIDANFNQVDAQALDKATSSSPVGAVTLGPLYAAGGTVTVNAGTLTGGGSITAYGGPTITVTNDSPDYLILDTVEIPYLPGGEILFTGVAGQSAAQSAGIALNPSGPGASPVVKIQELYPDAVGTSTFGPALFLGGDVDNLGGAVAITNADGSVGQLGTINAEQVNITAPNGVEVISPASGIEFTGAAPYSEWNNYMIWPGGNPTAAVPSANTAAAYAANAVYNSNGQYGTDPSNSGDNSNFTGALIGHAGDPAPGTSQVFYGDDLPWVVDGDTDQSASNLSPVGEFYRISGSADDGFAHDYANGIFPMVPVEPLSKTASSYGSADLSGSQASAIHAAQILINANVLDVNSAISVGQPNAWSLSLPSSLTGLFGAVTFDRLSYEVFGGSGLFDLPVAPVSSGDQTISAQYDAVSNQIIVHDVSASSGGGFLSLDGGIMNTNALGHIHVNGGLGAVTIDNQTGIPLVVDNVYAGTNSLSATVESQVDIIDTNQPAASRHTLYVYQPGGGIDVYHGTASQTAAQLIQGATPTVLSGATSTSYSPETGLRWQWTLQASLSRTVFENYDGSGNFTGLGDTNWTFAVPTGEINANNPWVYLDANGDPTPATPSGTGSTPTGEAVVQPGLPTFQEKITGSTYDVLTELVHYHSGHYGFATDGEKESDGTEIDPWYYDYVGGATLTLTTSVAADNAIGIDFSGLTRGEVNITSNAPVELAGNVVNPNGDTTVTAQGAITRGAGVSVASNNLTLTATGGVGAADAPVSATLTSGGVLNVSGGSAGVYLAVGSSALVGQVSAGDAQGYGDVVINATGSLDPAPGLPGGTVNVTGNNITLSAGAGEVGTASDLLHLAAHGTPLVNGGTNGGVVNVSALNDIGLSEDYGNLEVGQIVSTAGNVTITVPSGQIFDASGTTSAQVLSETQIEQVWQNLGLTNASASQQSVTAFDNQVNSEYVSYWQLLRNGGVSGGVFTLDGAAVPLYVGQTAASLGIDPSVVTPAEVQTYANTLYQNAVAFFNDNLDPNWASSADFLAYDPTFAYDVTAHPDAKTQAADLTKNALWTENQLRYAIDRVALNPTAGTSVGNGTPNVAGVNVTLLAQAAGDGVGSLGTPTEILLSDLTSGNLSPAQIAALAVATAPGDVVEEGADANGHTVTFTFGQQPQGVTLTGVQVSTTVPLFVAATGQVTATVGGAVYIQGTSQDLTLNKVTAGGTVNITAPRSILSGGGSAQIVTPGGVTLLAGTGSIGASAAPVHLQITGPLTLASAAQDVYLSQSGADLSVNRVAAGGQVQLTSSAGIYPVANSGLNVLAKGLDLEAAGGAGTSPDRLQIRLGTGELTGTVGGDVYLESTAALNVGNLTSTNGSVDIVDDAGGVTLGAITAADKAVVTADTGNVTNAAGGAAAYITAPAITLSALLGTVGTAASSLMIDTSGSATSTVYAYGNTGVYLDDVKGDLRLDQVTAATGDVVLAAAGSIIDGDNDSRTKVSGANVTLTAGGGIGTASHDLKVDSSGSAAGVLSASAGSGVYITQAAGGLNVGTVGSTSGDVRLTDVEAADQAENLVLGSTSSITAGGNVLLRIGDNVTLNSGSLVRAAGALEVHGDYDNGAAFNPDPATSFNLLGQLFGSSVFIHGDDDGDVFNIRAVAAGSPSSPSTIKVEGDGNNDTFNISSDAPADRGNLAGIQGKVIIVGGGGNDNRLIVSDYSGTAPKNVTLTGNTIVGFAGSEIDYSLVNGASFRDPAGADGILLIGSQTAPATFNVQSTLAGSTTTIRSGGAADTYNVGSTEPATGGTVDNIQGALTVIGGGGDTMNIDDTGSKGQKSGTLTPTTLTGLNLGAAGITYSGLSTLTVRLGSGGSTVPNSPVGNTFTINDINAATHTSVDGGVSSNDTVNVTTAADFNGQLNLTGFEHGSLTVNGNLNGAITDTQPGHLENVKVAGSVAPTGSLLAGGIDTMTVGVDLAGAVAAQQAITNLTVTRDVSGSVTESGTIQDLSIGGSLTSTGVLKAVNPADPVPPKSPNGLLGDVTTLTVGGALAGQVQTSGNLTTLTVGPANTSTTGGVNDLSGRVTVGGALTTASVAGNVSGTMSETLTINSLFIGQSLTPTGVINAFNAASAPLGNINTLTITQDLTGTVNVSGTIHNLKLINGSIAPTASLTLGSLDSLVIGPSHLSVGQNMAGTLTVTGNLGSVQVAGGIPGWIKGGHIGTIAAYGGFGPVVLRVTENGIERRVEEAVPSLPYPLPNPYAVAGSPYVNVQFIYEGTLPGSSGTLPNPQLTARITNNVGTSRDQYDLSLVTYNDAAKFNLTRLDTPSFTVAGSTTKKSTTVAVASKSGLAVGQAVSGAGIPAGTTIAAISNTASSITLSNAATATASNVTLTVTVASGARNIDVEGDLLTGVTATAEAFLGLPTAAGGLVLPADALAGVGVRDFIPNSSIQAASVQAVAFGSHAEENGQIFTGAASQGEDAQDMLVTGTQMVQANDTFRAPFADLATQQAQLFFVTDPNGGHFDDNGIVLSVQSVTGPNAAGTANVVAPSNVARGAATALVNVVPTYDSHGNVQPSVVQSIAVRGDGASITTQQSFSSAASISSTGPLGDLTLREPQGLYALTAPSVFGSVNINGPITGIAQTTGQRTDPITSVVTTVPADWGRLYVNTSGKTPFVTATTIQSGGVSGELVSRGDLISQITANGGGLTGVVAAQGNLGKAFTSSSGQSTRLGGLVANGQFNGELVVLGQVIGDMAFNGGLKGGGRVAVKGGIVGNFTINGGLDSTAAVVSGGEIGDTTLGTVFTVNGGNKGIIAAKGAMNFGKGSPGGYVFNNATGGNAAAIDAIFTNNGSALAFDINALDLGGLNLILTDLAALYVDAHGNLAGPKA